MICLESGKSQRPANSFDREAVRRKTPENSVRTAVLQNMVIVAAFLMAAVGTDSAGYLASIYATPIIGCCGCYILSVLAYCGRPTLRNGGIAVLMEACVAVYCLSDASVAPRHLSIPLMLIATALFLDCWRRAVHLSDVDSDLSLVNIYSLQWFLVAATVYAVVFVIPMGQAYLARTSFAMSLCRKSRPI